MKGSVLLEFAIVVPLLVVFFLGISGIGQLLGHVTWISQTTYAAALFAADVPQPDGPAKVQQATERLSEAQNRGQVSGDWNAPVYTVGQITGKPIVSVSVPANVSPLVSAMFSSSIGVSVAAPYLVPSQAAFAGFNDFANPSGIVTCYAASCNPIAPYNPGIRKITTLPGETNYAYYNPTNEESTRAFETFMSTMGGLDRSSPTYIEDAAATYEKLMSAFEGAISNDPSLAKALTRLDPMTTESKKSTRTEYTILD
ncbi:MAG: pilus assembly protein [Deltaproteobacteria bacterium]|nr:pilus assembly protein [Deltaproteobacteria bacterium]